jgi:hypothetical protein
LLSINGVTEHVSYNNAVAGPGFDRRQLFARYSLTGSRTSLQLRAGENQIDRGGVTTGGTMVALEIQRRIAGRSIISLSAGRELTDAGSFFGGSGSINGVSTDTQSLAQGSNPYTNEYVKAGWDVAGRLTRLGGSVAFYRESYLSVTTLNRDRLIAEIHAYRDLGSRLALRVTASHSNDDFRNLPADSREMIATAGLTWRLGQRLSIDSSYEHSFRHSDVGTSEYLENRIWLSLRWGDALLRNVGSFGAL